MRYVEVDPGPRLRPHVECLWALEGGEGGPAEVERIVPDGLSEIVFHLADVPRRCLDGVEATQASALLAGQLTGPVLLRPPGRTSIVAARLRAHAIPTVLGVPGRELAGRIDPAEDVLGARARRWRERIGAAPTVDAALGELRGALERALDRNLPRTGRPDAIARAVRLLAASHGALPIDVLAADVGLSRRQLERTFLERVGVSPKRYARYVRFAAVVAALEELAPPSLARIAAEFGYADQPHLNRDFRELAGCSPRVFRAERNPWNASFVTGSS